jgi:hypothetical protein
MSNLRELTEAIGVLNLALKEVSQVQVDWRSAQEASKMAQAAMNELAKAIEEGSRGQDVGMRVDKATKDVLAGLRATAESIGEPGLAEILMKARRSLGLRYERMAK